MMQVPIYQLDAFTDRIFAGNPAAIYICEDRGERTGIAGKAVLCLGGRIDV